MRKAKSKRTRTRPTEKRISLRELRGLGWLERREKKEVEKHRRAAARLELSIYDKIGRQIRGTFPLTKNDLFEVHRLLSRLQWLDLRIARAFDGINGSDPIALRGSLIVAIGALADIYDSDNHLETKQHLHALLWAIADLDSGIVHPLLKPNPLDGRAPDPSLVWGIRMQVAAAIECLIISGMSKKAAVRHAARNYEKLGILVRPAQELDGCLNVWHRNFMSGRIEHVHMQERFVAQALHYGFGARSNAPDDETRRKYLGLAKSYLEYASDCAERMVMAQFT